MLWADGGRIPEPTLAENEVADVCRESDEALREDTDEDSELIFGGPARAVAFTAGLTGLELGGAAGFVFISPPLSTKVFRFGAGSDAIYGSA